MPALAEPLAPAANRAAKSSPRSAAGNVRSAIFFSRTQDLFETQNPQADAQVTAYCSISKTNLEQWKQGGSQAPRPPRAYSRRAAFCHEIKNSETEAASSSGVRAHFTFFTTL